MEDFNVTTAGLIFTLIGGILAFFASLVVYANVVSRKRNKKKKHEG